MMMSTMSMNTSSCAWLGDGDGWLRLAETEMWGTDSQ